MARPDRVARARSARIGLVLAAVLPVALAVGIWRLFEGLELPEHTREPEVAAERPEVPRRRAAIDPGACRLTGTIEGGAAARVSVHSARAEIDLDAELDAAGRSFTVELPEQGPLFAVAVDREGRAAQQSAVCGPEGAAHVTITFTAARGDARVRGVCSYLETGAPVAGAVVRASQPRVRGRASGVEWTALADDRGAFSARVPAGRYALTCTKDMDESEELGVTLEPRRELEVALTVTGRASVLGQVVDGNEDPVPGVRVTGRGATRGRDEVAREEHTDREGRFRLRGLSPGPVTITAESDGRFAEVQLIARPGLPYAEVRLVLTEAGPSITGQVNGPFEVPIEGATVRVVARGSGWRPPRVPMERTVITGADGRFTAGGLVAGRYRVEATAEGHASAQADVELVTIAEVVLALPEACRARVRVVPADPPLAVTVRVDALEDEENRWARGPIARVSGSTGALLPLEGLAGSVALVARTEGALARSATIAIDLCAAPDPIVLDLAPAGRGAIEATVRDRDRRPLAGVDLELAASGPNLEATTDAQGRARFEGLEAGDYGVRAAEGFAVPASVRAGETTHVELTVDRDEGEVSGVVVAQGRPVEGAAIRAECGDSGAPRTLRDAPIVARSDASGSFAFTPRGGGVCLVRAEAPAHGASDAVTLRAGSLPAWIELVSYATIEGRVVEQSSGRPLAPYTLTIRPVSRAADVDTRAVYVAAADGRFRAEGLPSGTLSIAVTSERGRAHAEVAVGPGETRRGIEIAVFAEGAVAGRVVGPEGAVAGANVQIRRITQGTRWGENAAEGAGEGTTGEDGRFEIRVEAGDLLRAYVGAEGFYPWGSPPFTLQGPGRPVELGEIRVQPRSGEKEKEGGIGIMFGVDPHGVRVIQFTEDSPAREAGLELGDVITAIDGTPAGRLPLVSWLIALRGPPGTAVVLEIERGTHPRFSTTVIRRAIGLGAVPDAP